MFHVNALILHTWWKRCNKTVWCVATLALSSCKLVLITGLFSSSGAPSDYFCLLHPAVSDSLILNRTMVKKKKRTKKGIWAHEGRETEEESQRISAPCVCLSLHGWGIRTIPACRRAVWPLNFGYRIKVPAGHLLAEMLNGADAAEETEAARRVRLQTARLNLCY